MKQSTQKFVALSKALETFNDETSEPDTFTENGAPAYLTTDNYCVDAFSSVVRGTPEERVVDAFTNAWSENPQLALAILLNLRDCRDGKSDTGGKGEKLVSYFGLLWLRENYPATYLLNLPVFLDHGCFKDLCQLSKLAYQRSLTKLGQEYVELEYFAEWILADKLAIESKSSDKVPLTLSAKWAPTEKTHFDKKENGNQAYVLAQLIFPGFKGMTAMRKYRKLLGSLRENMKIVERLMAAGRWTEINFSTLPAKAHRLLRKAFVKHAPNEYNKYLELLSEGKVKINSTGTQPHELVKLYLSGKSSTDQTIEGQWKDLVQKLAKTGTLGSALAISDVSGSMEGIPMNVSIAFGILLSELVSEPFKGKLITFSEIPEIHRVSSTTLYDKVKEVSNMKWGMNTDLMAVFKLLLNFAEMNQVLPEDMVKTLFIFTDMQFDQANNSGLSSSGLSPWKTTYQNIQELYLKSGYSVPQIVFWNLRETSASFPVKADCPGVSLVSGFSSELLKVFLNGDIADMTPSKVMMLTVEPYLNLVKVHPTDLKK
jgi:hypothetical protein